MSYLWSCFVAGCSGTERHFISRIFLWKSMHTNTKITNQFNCEKVSISMWVHLGQISAVIWQPLWNHMLSIYKVRQYVWPPADFYGDQLHFCCYLFLQFFFSLFCIQLLRNGFAHASRMLQIFVAFALSSANIYISTELLLFWAIHSFPFGMFIYFLFSFVVGVIVVLLLFLLLRKLLLFLHTTTLLCVVLDDSFDTSEWALVTHKCTHTHLLSIYSIVLCATRWQTHAILKWKRNKNTKFTGGSQVAAGKCGFWWLARGIQQ